MEQAVSIRAAAWVTGLAGAAGLQLWWWSGFGPAWVPVVTGPVLVAATLELQAGERRRSDPEAAARAALRADADVRGSDVRSGGLVGARQG